MNVSITLHLRCDCGVKEDFRSDGDAWVLGVHGEAIAQGWRFDSKIETAFCPKCAPKKRPYLISEKKDGSQRNPPRKLRWVQGVKSSKKVQSPRRIRRT